MLEASVVADVGTLQLDIELSARAHETVVLLGPNGAGKTTLLRALAGLVALRGGRVALDGHAWDDVVAGVHVATERRPIGFVFQDYLLFPHLSAVDNVAFGLRARGHDRASARRAATDWLGRMGLADHCRSKPRALSGGQAQRVALARALAPEPRVLLLDEPLAALDAGSRAEVRRDLRRHLASFEGVRLVVTHDPMDAVLLAERLIVLEGGRVVQEGSMAGLSARPRSRYVANLVGLNLFFGRASGDAVALSSGATIVVPGAGRGEVFAAVHPRAVALFRVRPDGSPRNVWAGTVTTVDVEGDRVRVGLTGAVPIVAEITLGALAELGLSEGNEVWAAVKASEISVYPA